ncbi:MAG: hypothetical protein MJ053_03660 [Elusimicrobiaceae bacterium]|nr:hypothetical protein [Elusimicrobiaceae bacterium]
MPGKKTVLSSSEKTIKKDTLLRYRPEFCDKLLAFFDVPAFHVTEVTKRDGSVSLVETAAELPTFAAFAKQLGTTCEVLKIWESKHPAFREAAKKARDLQSNILIQNSLRGNYSASFAVFTAKNLLGWKDGKDDIAVPITVSWEDK